MKLIFLNRFFHPDHSATSQLLSDLTFALAAGGRSVLVITGRQRYDAPDEPLPARETVNGVEVHRVWTSRFGRAKLPGRALDYATFYMAAAWRLWRIARRGDVVVAKTDPPMLSVMAAPICRLRGAGLVNWLQDIFPETAEALGVGGRLARIPFGAMRLLRNRSLQAARLNVVLGERMAELVAALGIGRERIRTIPNWADGASVEPIEHSSNPLRSEWSLDGAFVVGYSGNLGRAHEMDTIVEAMTIASASEQPVVWLFVGGGALLGRLKGEVERRGLKCVRFQPYQPRERLAQSLSAADVHLVCLRPELEGLIVPSKFYGIAAAGRPTLFIGDEDGEIARLAVRYRCGRAVASGDSEGLARAVLELASDPLRCRRMGENGREAFTAELDKPVALARWGEMLSEAALM